MINGIPATTADEIQLNIHDIIRRAAKVYPRQEIISRSKVYNIFRYTYRDCYARICKLANALRHLIDIGDRVGVLSWNTHRCLELYYAIPSIGGVIHQLNLRLSPHELVYIINHAEDKLLVIDENLIRVAEQLVPKLKTVESYIIMSDGRPEVGFKSVYYYEDLINEYPPIELPVVNEKSGAIMCYTTGTTGLPKGVIYSHRSVVLHTLDSALITNQRASDVILIIVPMFHVQGWMLPFTGIMVGAKLVLPGVSPTPEILAKLILDEKVTLTAGVPTVFALILEYLRSLKQKPDLSHLRILCGGSEPPLSLMQAYKREFGAEMIHAWGMTEQMSLGTICVEKPYLKLTGEEMWKLKTKQGIPLPLMELEVVDSNGRPVPRDGRTVGEIWIKGPYVVKEYYKDPEKTRQEIVNGWLRTGDLATIDLEGYIKIVDRTKDVIKSGGEWISSIDMENHLMAHPYVLEATVVGIRHPKWGERPLALVVLREEYGGKPTEEIEKELREHLSKRFAKWQLPDKILFVKEIPKTSVGKFDKKAIREQYKDLYMATA
jgi:fatty-acyl-CoA synthase